VKNKVVEEIHAPEPSTAAVIVRKAEEFHHEDGPAFQPKAVSKSLRAGGMLVPDLGAPSVIEATPRLERGDLKERGGADSIHLGSVRRINASAFAQMKNPSSTLAHVLDYRNVRQRKCRKSRRRDRWVGWKRNTKADG